jgi:hypothetical protein
MIERAKVDGQIEGVIPHLVDGGLFTLQYVDDTILFNGTHSRKGTKPKINFRGFQATFMPKD